MFDCLFLKLERQDQGRGPNQKCVKITFNLPLVNAPINALHLLSICANDTHMVMSQYGSLQYHFKMEYDFHWRLCMPPDAVS